MVVAVTTINVVMSVRNRVTARKLLTSHGRHALGDWRETSSVATLADRVRATRTILERCYPIAVLGRS
jgi:hypothetical protein